MEMGLHDFVIGAIKASGLTYQEIADGSGVNKRTVEKIARREIDDPGVSHVEKLATFLRAQQEPPSQPEQGRAAA